MMGRIKRIVVGIALATVLGVPGVVKAQDEIKPSDFDFISDSKSGLTDEDRQIAADFLAERGGQSRAVPRDLVATLKATRCWLPDVYDEFAIEVPQRLARRLSAPKEGTRRIIFDRSLVVISSKGRVLEILRSR